MERKHRAKQFAAFDALKGYEEAIRQQERILMPYRELSPEQQEMIDRKLRELSCGDHVRVMYFLKYEDEQETSGDYVIIEGTVMSLDKHKKKMRIDETEIDFCMLCDVSVLRQQEGQS